MKSLEDLKKVRLKALKKVNLRLTDKSYKVMIGMATCGIAAGARPVLNACIEYAAKHPDLDCTIQQTDCLGMCEKEPIMIVEQQDGQKFTYIHVDPKKAIEIIQSHIQHHQILEQYLNKEAL